MKLRTRLVLWLTLLLTAVVLVMGAVVVRSNRDVLIGQIDQELLSYAQSPNAFNRRGRPTGFAFLPDEQAVALVRFDELGSIIAQAPSGLPDSPDPLPDVSRVAAPRSGPYLLDLTAEDRTVRYRAVVFETTESNIAVVAVPLEDVEASIAALLRTTLWAAITIALVGGAAMWFTVTTGLKPVDKMVRTAKDIASGDLTSRIEDVDDHTELGQLGGALNDMLTQIQSAFDVEREAQTVLQRFVADASHELRTPLTAISGYMQLYQKGALTGEALDSAVDRIRRESTRMTRLVEDMLLLARLDEQAPGDIRTVDLMSVINDVANDHRAIDPTRPVTISGPESLLMTAAESRVTQMIANLLANARQHTPPNTKVSIDVKPDEDEVTVSISDTGPGIDPEHIPQLFDRFYRVDASRTRATGGSGLGLAIVAALVAAQGGSVRAENAESGGARFQIVLPLGRPDQAPLEPPNASITASEKVGHTSSDHSPN